MAEPQRRNGILAVTYSLLAVTASWMTARFVAWQHEGWAGFYYAPAMPEGFKGKTVFFKPGTVSSVFSGGPAEAAGFVVGDELLTVNGVPTSDWERLAKLDDQLRIHDEITYQVQHKNGLREFVRLQLSSPLRSRQIEVSTITSLAVAAGFCLIGTIVYRRKPEDERALIFYFLSLAATTLFVVRPLVYVDEFPSRGARSLPQMTGHQVVLYVVLTVLGYLVQVLFVHLALVFPQRRRVLENNPQLLRWLYLTPLLTFVGFPTFAMLSLPMRVLRLALFGLWLLVLMMVVYLAKYWIQEGWKPALRTRPVTVLGLVGILVITSMDSVLMLVPSEATRQTIGWVFGGITFGFTYLVFFVTYSIIACVALYRSYRESGIEERKQVRWPLWGTIVSLSGVLLLIGLRALIDWLGFERFLPIVAAEVVEKAFYVFIPLSFAFAILKYRLMEIDVVIRKTVTYSIVSGCVAAVYFAIAGGLGGLLIIRAGVHSTWITVGATLATVAVFVPVRKRIQNIVDKRFFRRKEDLPHALRALNAKTTEITDLPALLNLVAEHLVQVLQVRSAVIFRKSLREQTFTPTVEVGLHDRIEPTTLLKGLRFACNTPLLASAGVAFRPPSHLPDAEQMAVKQLGTALIVPMRRGEEAIGFISLGRKLSDQEFEPDEIEFLAAAADTTASAIYNLGLRKQAQEYQEAREIQERLLPKQIPQAPGLEISGSWSPARIVGGDYFDVFRLGESKLGLCIGDVSGKGMPAALLMCNLQAVVKALATEGTSPRELVAKANRVMWVNTTEDKFITLFYAVVDAEARTLQFTNAGHNAPVLTHQDGTQVRLEEGGLILGAFQEAAYAQGQIDLRRGDRLVMFTDGVTEAVNGEDEEFGEKRLVAASLRGRQLSAEDLHRFLLDLVTEFCGGEFEDDATVLVVAVSWGS
ncbi:MAG TPA: SpoIIE family protein phosphatase [Candidatus Acidoferrum sp.]|nr:SpoIIE family protein phosphatase [Candidatus Acidoferrum sp.]